MNEMTAKYQASLERPRSGIRNALSGYREKLKIRNNRSQ